MPKFDLYVGLSGGFGGAKFEGTYEFNSFEEAENEAYLLAREEYESYGGHHGLMNWDEAREDLIESFGEEPTDEEVDDHYNEYVEGWLSYYVRPHDDNIPLEELGLFQ